MTSFELLSKKIKKDAGKGEKVLDIVYEFEIVSVIPNRMWFHVKFSTKSFGFAHSLWKITLRLFFRIISNKISVDFAFWNGIEIEILFPGNHQFCEHITTPTSFFGCQWAKESEIFAGCQFGVDDLQWVELYICLLRQN